MSAVPAPALQSVPAPEVLLAVRDLHTHFPVRNGLVKAVDGISFDVARGKTLLPSGR